MRDNGKPWSPYLAGAFSGLLAVASVLAAGKYLGASTTFVRVAGMVEQGISTSLVQTPYYLKYALEVDWQFMFLVGIVLGAFLTSLSDRTFEVQKVPGMWKERFGSAWGPRAGTAFIGGVVLIYGARLAGGCPSGHGLSGLSQMAVSGFLAVIFFFVGGIISARILYGGERK